MGTALKNLTREALDLSERDRAKLAHVLIRSIDGEADSDAKIKWDAEIKKRVSEIRSGKVKGVPVARVVARLRKKYR
jgi:putative addiction module component (TIGR02574 family)